MSTYEVDGKKITITADCVGCSACVDGCPAGVLELKDGVCTAPRVADCVQCHACEGNCGCGAIQVE
ncbi:hypothetical protein ENUP19_0292G0005 [Entamoeba nuttalli]|uniref:4Fe-4S ferredoxin-type domain-containing protein n=1 Tax=Entamoeba nuttalli TaxID=412467 RepID=A0ABQ0DUA6_9EUKA